MKAILSTFLIIMLSLTTASAWQDNRIDYLVEKNDTSPQIDGNISDWESVNQIYETSITPVYFQGITRVYIELSIVRDDTNLYILLKFENKKAYNDSFSAGIAFSDTTPDTMSDFLDNKIAYYNRNVTERYDLNNCETVSAELDDSNFIQPCKNDTLTEFKAEHGIDDNKHIFEFSIPLTGVNSTEDISIAHGTYLSIIVNIYDNIYNFGHGSISTNPLKLIYFKILSNPIFIISTIVLSTFIFIKLIKKLVPDIDRIQ